MNLSITDIENSFPDVPRVDCPVYLVRKVSQEILIVYFERFNKTASCDVYWDRRHRYKLDLVKNQVVAIDSTAIHRQNMKTWYTIWEPHRILLLQEYYDSKRTR